MPPHISSWIFKIISPIFVVGIVIFAIWSGIHQKESSKTANTVATTTQNGSDIASNPNNTDSDHDGLKDWEEALWKTDPKNPDTDGDGTPDGEEVKEGRDPAKKGPNDYLTVDQIGQITSSQNGSVQTQNSQKVAPKTVSSTTSVTIAPKIDPNVALGLKTYGNSLGIILKKRDSLWSDKETEIFASITSKIGPTASDFDGLASLGTNYAEVSQSVKKISPPEGMMTLHSALIDGYVAISGGDAMLATYKSAGSIPISAFKSYNESSIKLGDALIAIALYFKQNGIVFGKEEPGAIFNLQ